ncbi:MAG: glycosyltransferase family 2 protein [Candidatus Thorarchaeota archaeon]
MQISIVTTMYRSAPYINEFYSRITETVKKITSSYEIIFVNDGSSDNSLEIAKRLFEKDKKIKIIDLSRNFGHHKAIMAGLSYTKGEYVFLTDCDLEDEPELLIDFWNEMKTDKSTYVVFGYQENRKGNIFKKISGNIFYSIFNSMSDVSIHKNPLTIRLMKKKYVDALIMFKESDLYLAGLMELAGFKQKGLAVNRIPKKGTVYTLKKRIGQLITSITSFSSYPLKLIFYIGFTISIISFIFAIYIFVRKLMYNSIVSGWTSVMVSLWFTSGILMMFLGIIGFYLAKIYIQVKNRPLSIIKEIYSMDKKNAK